MDRHACRPTRTRYPDSEPTSLCSFSLMLRAELKSNKYQFYSVWFDPTVARPTIYCIRGEHGNYYTDDAVKSALIDTQWYVYSWYVY